MTAPNPVLRISPSGPPTTGDTDPLVEYAGISLQALNSTTPADEAIATIGPLGSLVNPNPLILPRAGAPTTVVGTPRGSLGVVGSPSSFGLSAGEWLVEGTLQVGYLTDGPATNADAGGVRVTAQIVNNSNAIAASGVSPILWGARSGADSAPAFVGSRSQSFAIPVNVTPAMVQANGGAPLRGLQLVVERVTGTNTQLVYGAQSGDLLIQNGTTVNVRRYR